MPEKLDTAALAAALEEWDGKSTDLLLALHARHAHAQNWVDTLLTVASEKALTQAGTWLLKHHLEAGGSLAAEQGQQIYAMCGQLTDWQSILHVLQMMPHLDVQLADEAELERFLRAGLVHDNKFVRAWSYNGFYLFAQAYPAYQTEAASFFDMAMRDEPASVRARVRKLIRAGFVNP